MAAGSTYTPIATTTLGSAQASYTFSSISGSYTDLILVVKSILSSGAGTMWFQLNTDTATNYSDTFLYGNGTSVTSTRNTTVSQAYFADALSSEYQTSILQFQNYSNATTYKTVLIRGNDAGTGVNATVALWRSTAAINQITISSNAGTNFASGSTFTIYGIAAA